MGQSASAFRTDPSDPSACASFVDDYAGALVSTYRTYTALDDAGGGDAVATAAMHRRWIDFSRVLQAVHAELRGKECADATVNLFERVCLDAFATMRARIPPPTRRLPGPSQPAAAVFGPPSPLAADWMRTAARLRTAAAFTPTVVDLGSSSVTPEYVAALMQFWVRLMFEDAGRSPSDGARYQLQDDRVTDSNGRITSVVSAAIDDPTNHGDTDLTLRLAATVPDDHTVGIGEFRITVGELRRAAAATYRSIAVDAAAEADADAVARHTVALLDARGRMRPEGYAAIAGRVAGDAALCLRAEAVAVVGPVWVPFDAGFESQAANATPLVCVSGTAPNLAVDDAAATAGDRSKFVADGPPRRAAASGGGSY
jgi:hypothetical protein